MFCAVLVGCGASQRQPAASTASSGHTVQQLAAHATAHFQPGSACAALEHSVVSEHPVSGELDKLIETHDAGSGPGCEYLSQAGPLIAVSDPDSFVREDISTIGQEANPAEGTTITSEHVAGLGEEAACEDRESRSNGSTGWTVNVYWVRSGDGVAFQAVSDRKEHPITSCRAAVALARKVDQALG